MDDVAYESKPVSLSDVFKTYDLTPKKTKITERGELMKYFAQKIRKPIGYVAMRLTNIPTSDLYYIKSSCDLYERDGNPWAKAFYGSLKTR